MGRPRCDSADAIEGDDLSGEHLFNLRGVLAAGLGIFQDADNLCLAKLRLPHDRSLLRTTPSPGFTVLHGRCAGGRSRLGGCLRAHGAVGHGAFEHPIEHHPAAAGAAAVEAERELVPVTGHGQRRPPSPGGCPAATVCPARRDPVHRGKEFAGVVPARPGGRLAAPVVDVAELLQPAVACPASRR